VNCDAIEALLLTERDGVLTPDQHAALVRHVADCPACRERRTRIAAAMDAFRADAASVTVPGVDAEWRTLRARLPDRPGASRKQRPLAPVIWFTTSFAAAASLAFVFFSPRPPPAAPLAAVPEIAQAEFVEAGDAAASTMVYVDKDSGWLVVWATDDAPKTSG
jgi:anti-sigma factor RsiW